jgi:hypothetical protein
MILDDVARRSVVVVRDRDLAALRHPEPRIIGEHGTVVYVHASRPEPLPGASHYIFNLERLDAASRERACSAHEAGVRVTLILQHIDEVTARFLTSTTWNVLPAYGDVEHIGVSTFRRALRMALDGVHVVARGFLQNSSPPSSLANARPASSFVRLLRRISEEAAHGEAVVAAVLAPHRTGSQWLRDLIGWTTGSEVRVAHEHTVPAYTATGPVSRNLADALAREPDPERHKAIRRAAFRSVLLTARRRYIFVTYRDPVDRVVSYFIKRHSQFLRERLDPATQTFLDPSAIQAVFERWLPEQVKGHSHWFRTTLFDHFGLDVCRAEPTDDGLLLGRHEPNTLVVVPVETLSSLRDAVEAEYGREICAPLADDSAVSRGDGPIAAAFRRDVQVPPVVATALRSIREAAHICAHTRNLPGVRRGTPHQFRNESAPRADRSMNGG